MQFPPADAPSAFSTLAGRHVSTWSEEWKLECEIQAYASMPLTRMNAAIDGTPEDRGVKQIRGERAAALLRADIERWMTLKRG